MLITSSQASVALTALIVFTCTTALFLSGYAIQQRTLRHLRAAIKPSPRPSPHIFIEQSAEWQAAASRGEAGLLADTDNTGGDGAKSQDSVEVTVEETMPDADGLNADGLAQKPLSSMERRKRIKEEIQKLSQGETPIYYQRRVW